MDKKYLGSCLCGTVRFEIEGSFKNFFLCHCQYCRKDSGSAHAANLFAPQGRLTWLAGQENTTTFTLPTTRHKKSFCNTCGSALPTTQREGQLLVVPAGSLDSDVDIEPKAHIFCASKANWDTGFTDTPRFEKLPG